MKLLTLTLAVLCMTLTVKASEEKSSLLKKLLRGLLTKDFQEKQGVGTALVKERSFEKRGSADIVQTVTAFDENGNDVEISVKDACLKAHNKVRGLHQATNDLTYDDDLATGAADWSKKMASTGKFDYDHSHDNGENIFYKPMSPVGTNTVVFSPAYAVFSWYQESWEVYFDAKSYDYGSESNPGTGHFTQVVWKGSTKVGCGVATVNKGGMQYTYITARYSEPGNIRGSYKANVKPLISGAQQPENPGSLETVDGCLNYGDQCGNFAGYGFCDMIKDTCGCSCG